MRTSILKTVEIAGPGPAQQERITIKEDSQGPATVEHHTRGATARINFYILSLEASRLVDGNLYLDHVPSYAPAPINTVEEASAHGLREAEERWPTTEGWSHRVEVKLVKLTFEFTNKPSL